jgi:hypothetical protein
MTDPSADPLADDAFLDALLDTLIPPGERMPGAGSLGLAASVRARVEENAMLKAPMAAALSALQTSARERDAGGLSALDADARSDVVAKAMAGQPMLGMFPLLLYSVYYQHPRVREALGQHGGAPFPRGYAIEATDASLLAKLKRRG